MEINVYYLTFFIVFAVVILLMGLWGYQKVRSISDYAVAGRSLPLPLAVATMVGTFVSAVTVIGGAGYASQFGWSFLIWNAFGALSGLALFTIAAKKIHLVGREIGVVSVSELIGKRYDSKMFQAYASVVVLFTYTVILIAQLFGIGYLMSGVIGVPMWIALAVIGVIFTLYATLGGMIAVARTDAIQVVVMLVGISLAVIIILNKLYGSGLSVTSLPELNTIWAGQTPNALAVFGWTVAWGLGVAAHPYYVQRVFICKNVVTARRMIGIVALLAVFFYGMANLLGVAGAVLVPDVRGDELLPFVLTNAIGGVTGGILLLALTAGIMSTTDSILNIIGSYFSNDIYSNIINRKADDAKILRVARNTTLIFGLVVTALCVYMSFQDIPLIAVIGAYGWSIIGGSIFIPLYAGLYWKRATKEGAFVASIAGIISGIAFHGHVPFHSIIPSVIISAVLMIVVSLWSKKTNPENLKPFFDFSTDHERGQVPD